MREEFRMLIVVLLVVGCAVTLASPVTAKKISQPDLVIHGVIAPSTADPGERVTLFTTVKNAGSGSSSYSYTYFYLSMDTVADSSDLYLGKSLIASLLSGRSQTTIYSATIPSASSGVYYILVKADGSNRISETDEVNNVGVSSQLTIGPPSVPTIVPTTTPTITPTPTGITQSGKPDLVITKSAALSSRVLGEKVTLFATVKNAGGGSSTYSYVYFYLSNDTVVDSSDSYLGNAQIASMIPGRSQTTIYSATIPSASSGVYYILVKADGSNRISETDEVNNVGVSSQLTIGPPSVPTIVPTTTPTITLTPTPIETPTPVPTPTETPTPTPTPAPTTETFGAESNPTGNPLGGGTGYGQVYTENDTRVKDIVDTKEEFLSALASAKAGDVIYIPESANIDLTGVMGTSVPSGVTIAGNRGINGSPGGRIFQNRLPGDPDYGGPTRTMLNIVGDNVRITGLRLEGPDKTTSALGEKVRRGIYVNQYNNLEVDNCELWGWSWSAVHLADPTSTRTMYVHHNNIHHCQIDGYGYGVCVSGGNMLVEGNIFDYTRHAVASSGLVGERYEARYNLVGSHATNHVFDVHEYTNPATGELIAGRSYKIHHNTVSVTNQYTIVVRAVPVEGAWIDHNKFQWRTSYDEKWSPVCQANGVGNMYMTQNLIGTPGVLYPNGPIRLL